MYKLHTEMLHYVLVHMHTVDIWQLLCVSVCLSVPAISVPPVEIKCK